MTESVSASSLKIRSIDFVSNNPILKDLYHSKSISFRIAKFATQPTPIRLRRSSSQSRYDGAAIEGC